MNQTLLSKTYQKVCNGLILTAIMMLVMATFCRNFILQMGTLSSILILVVLVVLMLAMNHTINNDNSSASATNFMYYLMTVIFGVALSPILIVYNLKTIGLAVIITGLLFGGLSFYAKRTKTNYIKFSVYLFWGLLASIILSVVAMILHISMLYFIIDLVMLVIFTVYIIIDTQSITRASQQSMTEQQIEKQSASYALNLYLDIINLFEIIVELLGNFSNDD